MSNTGQVVVMREGKVTALVAALSPKQRNEYEQSRLHYLGVKAAVDTAEMEGRKKGKTEIALQMKEEGFDNNTIGRLTGLTSGEIYKL